MRAFNTTLGAIVALLPTIAFASDWSNGCKYPGSTSTYIELPADDGMHYPSQWSGSPDKTSLYDSENGLELVYRAYHWDAVPVGGGDTVRIDGFVLYVAIFRPSPFANGERAWIRALVTSFVGPDGLTHQYTYAAPGEFAPSPEGFDLSIGGPGELAVIEVTDSGTIEFVADPTTPIGQISGVQGGNMINDFVSTDGFVELYVDEESILNPIFVLNDGYDPTLRYFYARPLLESTGTIRYGNVEYNITGIAREDRGWQQNLEQWAAFQYHWVSVQVRGCINGAGKLKDCQYTNQTYSVWNSWRIADGSLVAPYWNEMEPPKKCEQATLNNPNDWSLTPLDYWTSPRTGISYARTLEVTSPSREVDLVLTPVINDQEIYKAAFLFPGFYHGALIATGTIKNKTVLGDAMIEQWNMTP